MKDFYKIYGILSYLNYILWLFELNLLFLATNLPAIAVVYFLSIRVATAPLAFVAGLTLGPSLYAMFEALGKVEREDGPVRAYLTAWKSNFRAAVKPWAAFWFLILFILCDRQILSAYGVFDTVNLLLLLILCVTVTFAINFYIVYGTWKQDIKDALILTAKIGIVKAGRHNLSLMILIGTYLLLQYVPIYMALYGFSLAAFLIYKNFVPVIRYVNERPENAGRRQDESYI